MMDESGRFREVKVIDDPEGAKVTEMDGTPIDKPGAIFSIGEVVALKGRKFRVRKITKKDIVLRGLPSGASER
jgi:hypothetical protein